MAVTWNLENAAHLLSRAAFGGSQKDIQAFFSRNKSVASAVDELLSFKPSKLKPPSPKNLGDLTAMHRWWFQQMVNAKKTPDACREKLTLLWHTHLVSGISKQQYITAMSNQNLLFREYAAGNFMNLVREFNRDVANLFYLDGITNQATYDTVNTVPLAQPNENFGREVMELFTLGVFQFASDGSFDTTHPNYTENDVHQLARALTGWVNISKKGTGVGVWSSDLPNWDGGRCDDTGAGTATPVTIFGVTNNNFRIDDAVAGTDNDVLKLIFSQTDFEGNNVTAMFIARTFWSFFAYPPPYPGLKATLAPFAQIFQSSNYEVLPMLKAMWTSDAFYSDTAKSRTVKNPVDYIAQSMRAFQINNTDGKNVLYSPELGDAASNMGMTLFDPPNVAGWPGGLLWINSGTLLERLNFAANLANCDKKQNSYQLSVIPGLPKSKTSDPGTVLDVLLTYLGANAGPMAITAAERTELLSYLTSNGTQATLDLSKTTTNDAVVKVRGVISLILQLPEYMVF